MTRVNLDNVASTLNQLTEDVLDADDGSEERERAVERLRNAHRAVKERMDPWIAEHPNDPRVPGIQRALKQAKRALKRYDKRVSTGLVIGAAVGVLAAGILVAALVSGGPEPPSPSPPPPPPPMEG